MDNPAATTNAPALNDRGPVVLEAQNLFKGYRLGRGPNATVLSAVRDVSLQLRRSAVVALVGESGSGKSTVAKLLAGQERPTSGEVLLDGQPAHHSGRRGFRAYKSEVQMVFQDPFASLNPTHRVRYPLERAVRLHRSELGRRAVADELVRLMDEVRLSPAEEFLQRYPHQLSGGQRQRVSIARALAVKPRVLLADEPVSMLDVSIRLEVLDVIDQLRERFQLAVLYITHDIASARYFAEETLVMYAGEIVERGPSEDLSQSPAHPYTQLLLAAAPDPDRLGAPIDEQLARKAREAGRAPRTTVGCRFSSRCPFADDHCRVESPPLRAIDEHRSAACWHLDLAAPNLVKRQREERSVALPQ
ncbi:MAG TPA: ABC transporter ATP-binding protein [Solirubrobacteraceae bacterium]|jgi:peptide/nickel transport system ATP-binding protein|nr:ABC transporter ATP-binding protein [Solirubrobacteraceae bacterium]